MKTIECEHTEETQIIPKLIRAQHSKENSISNLWVVVEFDGRVYTGELKHAHRI